MLRVLIFISGQIFQGKSNMFKNKINPMKKKLQVHRKKEGISMRICEQHKVIIRRFVSTLKSTIAQLKNNCHTLRVSGISIINNFGVQNLCESKKGDLKNI